MTILLRKYLKIGAINVLLVLALLRTYQILQKIYGVFSFIWLFFDIVTFKNIKRS